MSDLEGGDVEGAGSPRGQEDILERYGGASSSANAASALEDPLDVLKRTFAAVPRAVHRLRPLVDEYMEVDNESPRRQPRFKAARDVRALLTVCRGVGGDWQSRFLEEWLPGFWE